VLDELRADGVGDELLARIDVPAGVEIGSRTAGEIAVSILAGVIKVRRRGGEVAAVPAPARIAVDPICGMTVAAVAGTPSVVRDGETFYFCGEGCRAKFEAQGGHASVAG
jgi:xanthine dehydrogenase accessory factor